MPHAVLLGDSIFDNGVYVGDGPDVSVHLRAELGPSWRVTLLARDGDVIGDIEHQLAHLPHDATHLVVSVGGNDALGHANVLHETADTVGDAVARLAGVRGGFELFYRSMLERLAARGLPTAVCTIYDANYADPYGQVVKGALALFNDAITRAAFARGTALIDLRLVCNERADYANPIEPSVQGGAKIAAAIASFLRDQPERRSTVWR
jgi:hypothetical protein